MDLYLLSNAIPGRWSPFRLGLRGPSGWRCSHSVVAAASVRPLAAGESRTGEGPAEHTPGQCLWRPMGAHCQRAWWQLSRWQLRRSTRIIMARRRGRRARLQPALYRSLRSLRRRQGRSVTEAAAVSPCRIEAPRRRTPTPPKPARWRTHPSSSARVMLTTMAPQPRNHAPHHAPYKPRLAASHAKA